MNKSTRLVIENLVARAKGLTPEEWRTASVALAVLLVRDGDCKSAQVRGALDDYAALVDNDATTDTELDAAELRISVELWRWVRR